MTMLSEVRTALSQVLGASSVLRRAAGRGRLFELFILTGIATRLRNHGCDVWLQRSDGSRIYSGDSDRRFVQRGGAPSGMPSAAQGTVNASVIAFRTASGSQWEIWNGIQFQGRSGATHEIDIAVVPAQIGNDLRTSGGGVPFGRPRVAIECKDVGTAGTVDEMRALVARLYDLTILQGHQPHFNFNPPYQAIYPGNLGGHSFHSSRFRYWDENRHTMNALARRAGFSAGSVALTSYYAIEPHGRIRVGSSETDALLDAVRDWIVSRCP
ncbi:MAG TPA: hypothetical protein VI485_09075 [Vicinamibacterales bacterium]|nr:hypothetical protein [Vicinamibacterales bacterium]